MFDEQYLNIFLSVMIVDVDNFVKLTATFNYSSDFHHFTTMASSWTSEEGAQP